MSLLGLVEEVETCHCVSIVLEEVYEGSGIANYFRNHFRKLPQSEEVEGH